MSELAAYEPEEAEELVGYLTSLYRNAFTTEAIRTHLVNHVGFGFADYAVAVTAPHLPAGARVLDLGAGFGSYVLAAREAGLDAIGIELAPFEVEFARRRSRRLRPQDEADTVYLQGDVRQLALPAGSFDAVTLWNVLEHVEDASALLATVARLLKPGGQVFVLCPNYATERDEAHYHVPWNRDLSEDRGKASDYLRSLGRDPTYYESCIFPRSNREVIGILERLGFALLDLGTRRPMSLRLRNLREIVKDPAGFAALRSDAKHSVEIVGVKGRA